MEDELEAVGETVAFLTRADPSAEVGEHDYSMVADPQDCYSSNEVRECDYALMAGLTSLVRLLELRDYSSMAGPKSLVRLLEPRDYSLLEVLAVNDYSQKAVPLARDFSSSVEWTWPDYSQEASAASFAGYFRANFAI